MSIDHAINILLFDNLLQYQIMLIRFIDGCSWTVSVVVASVWQMTFVEIVSILLGRISPDSGDSCYFFFLCHLERSLLCTYFTMQLNLVVHIVCAGERFVFGLVGWIRFRSVFCVLRRE